VFLGSPVYHYNSTWLSLSYAWIATKSLIWNLKMYGSGTQNFWVIQHFWESCCSIPRRTFAKTSLWAPTSNSAEVSSSYQSLTTFSLIINRQIFALLLPPNTSGKFICCYFQNTKTTFVRKMRKDITGINIVVLSVVWEKILSHETRQSVMWCQKVVINLKKIAH